MIVSEGIESETPMFLSSFKCKWLLFAVPLLSCTVSSIAANPITWTLSDVKLSDGSSITGFFTFDPNLPVPQTGLTDYRIAVSGGSVLPNFLYTPADPFSQLLVYSYTSPTGLPVEVIDPFRSNRPNGTALEMLYLDPVAFLSSAGGTVALDTVKSSGQLSNGEVTIATEALVSGSFIGTAATVPEPSSLPILLVAAAAAVFFRARATSRSL